MIPYSLLFVFFTGNVIEYLHRLIQDAISFQLSLTLASFNVFVVTVNVSLPIIHVIEIKE